MRGLHQDRGGIVALIALALIVIFLVILLLILFGNVQKVLDDIYRLFHPFGYSSTGWLVSLADRLT
jgi:hypothetical protein